MAVLMSLFLTLDIHMQWFAKGWDRRLCCFNSAPGIRQLKCLGIMN